VRFTHIAVFAKVEEHAAYRRPVNRVHGNRGLQRNATTNQLNSVVLPSRSRAR